MIVTIVSSKKHRAQIEEQYQKLTKENHIVLTPIKIDISHKVFDYAGKLTVSEDQLMALHKAKIDICDMVLVLNVNGYIGRSMCEEIGYAITHGKTVEYLEPLSEFVEN